MFGTVGAAVYGAYAMSAENAYAVPWKVVGSALGAPASVDGKLAKKAVGSAGNVAFTAGTVEDSLLQQLTGLNMYESAAVPDIANGMYDYEGNVYVSPNRELPLNETVQHEAAHGIGTEGYRSAVKGGEGFEAAVNNVIAEYAEAGIQISRAMAEDDVAAKTAQYFTVNTETNLPRLLRESEGNMRMGDYIHNKLRDLRARMKAKKSGSYTDPTTGITFTYEQLYKMEREWEKALVTAKERGYNKQAGNYDSIAFSQKTGNTNELVVQMRNNIAAMDSEPEIFNVHHGDIPTAKNATERIYNYFKAIGGMAVNPVLGNVELVKSGAKSTVFHGVGKDKITAVAAIKDVIEKGKIISNEKNWKNRGYDTHVILGKGKLEDENSMIGVIVKSYPDSKANSKFYVHEIIKLGAEDSADPNVLEYTVKKSAPNNNSVPHPDPKVNPFSKKIYSLKSTETRAAENAADRREYGIGVNSLVKNIMDEIGVSKNRRNEAEETAVRNALKTLKNGDERATRAELTTTFADLYKEARQPLTERDSEVLSAIRNSAMDLQSYKGNGELTPEDFGRLRSISHGTSEKASRRAAPDQYVMEWQSDYPEYFKGNEGARTDPAKQILDVYDSITAKRERGRYNPAEINGMARDMADRVIGVR